MQVQFNKLEAPMAGLRREPARAVRCAAIEALSYTSLGGNNLPELINSGEELPLIRARAARALSLLEAYAIIMEVTFESALTDLMDAAAELRRTRTVAQDFWTSVCAANDGDAMAAALQLATTPHPVVQAYAEAADVTYEEAHHALDTLHYRSCETHRVSPAIVPTVKQMPQPAADVPESHPGRHGVDVDTDRTQRAPSLGEIGEQCVLLHLAVMADSNMNSVPRVMWQQGRLDDIAQRDADIRSAEINLLGIEPATTRDYETMVWRVAAAFFGHGEHPTQEQMGHARNIVTEHVNQFFTYLEDAKREWTQLDPELRYNPEILLDLGRRNPGLAAVANALALGLAQTLVLIRTMVTEARPTEDRPEPRVPSWKNSSAEDGAHASEDGEN